MKQKAERRTQTAGLFLTLLFMTLNLGAIAGDGPGKGTVLMVVANPTTSAKTGWPVGFWVAEVSHPYDELVAAGYRVEIVSPDGGALALDAYSDPRHESGYSAHDFVSLGFLTSHLTAALLENTRSLDQIKHGDYKALIIAGGQAPMESFRQDKRLQKLIMDFYASGRPTAALCHGVAALVDVKTPEGKWLLDGKKVTGFSLAEDRYAEKAVGQEMFSWYVEPAMKERGAKYSQGGMWAEYALADGNLITGQQQNSGRAVARLVLQQLGHGNGI